MKEDLEYTDEQLLTMPIDQYRAILSMLLCEAITFGEENPEYVEKEKQAQGKDTNVPFLEDLA